MRVQNIICDACKEQYKEPGILLTFRGQSVDLCGSDCFARYMMRLYHRAMADGITLEITFRDKAKMEVVKR